MTLIDFDSATRDALEKTNPAQIERVWEDGQNSVKSIKHEGCFIDHREQPISADPAKALSAVLQFASQSKTFEQVRQTEYKISVHVKHQSAGDKWMEWRVSSHAKSVTYLAQTVFFCPRGLPGFLYWYLLYPFHVFKFGNSIRSIIEQSKRI